jgi:hypothetical protein
VERAVGGVLVYDRGTMTISTKSEAAEKAALARAASRRMSGLSTDQKNEVLERVADALWRRRLGSSR